MKSKHYIKINKNIEYNDIKRCNYTIDDFEIALVNLVHKYRPYSIVCSPDIYKIICQTKYYANYTIGFPSLLIDNYTPHGDSLHISLEKDCTFYDENGCDYELMLLKGCNGIYTEVHFDGMYHQQI